MLAKQNTTYKIEIESFIHYFCDTCTPDEQTFIHRSFRNKLLIVDTIADNKKRDIAC